MKETTLQVDGMSCSSCVRHINSALCELPGVEQVDVTLREGTVLVRHDVSSVAEETLIDVLRDTGYESRPHHA